MCEGCDGACFCVKHAYLIHHKANFTHVVKKWINNRFEVLDMQPTKARPSSAEAPQVCSCDTRTIAFRSVPIDVLSLSGTNNIVQFECCTNVEHVSVWLAFYGFAAMTGHNARHAFPQRDMLQMMEVRVIMWAFVGRICKSLSLQLYIDSVGNHSAAPIVRQFCQGHDTHATPTVSR